MPDDGLCVSFVSPLRAETRPKSPLCMTQTEIRCGRSTAQERSMFNTLPSREVTKVSAQDKASPIWKGLQENLQPYLSLKRVGHIAAWSQLLILINLSGMPKY